MHTRYRTSGSSSVRNPFSSISCTRKRSKKFFDGTWTRIDEYDYDVPIGTACAQSDLQGISDIVGRESGFNGCTHNRDIPTSLVFTPLSGESGALVDDLTTSWNVTGWAFNGASLPYSIEAHCNASTWAPSLPDIDWNSMVQSVGDRLDGSMDARTNILVSMAELGETMRMLKNPFGLLTARWRRSNKTLRQLSKAGANVWLEYKYGWKNFFRDFSIIGECLEKGSQHVAYLSRTKDSWAPVYAQQTDAAPCSIAVPSIGSYTNGLRVTVTAINATRTARFGCRILRGPEFNVLSKWQYAAQYVGYDRLVEALWDLVPMSFVVDWFVDISRFAALNPILWNQHKLRGVGYSCKTQYRADLTVEGKFLMYGPTSELLQGASVTSQLVRSSYERSPGFPADSSTAGIFGNFGKTALFDGASLILQRI